MARNAGPTTEILLKRVEEYGGLSTSLSFAMQLLSHCQQTVNAGLGLVIESAILPINIQQLVFNYRDLLPKAVDIITVSDFNDRRFQRVDRLSDFGAYDELWWRNITGTRIEAFCQIGRELLFLYPGLAVASNVVITYTKLTTEVNDGVAHYDTGLDLPDEYVDDAMSLAEAILLISSRHYDESTERIEDLIKSVSAYLIWRR